MTSSLSPCLNVALLTRVVTGCSLFLSFNSSHRLAGDMSRAGLCGRGLDRDVVADWLSVPVPQVTPAASQVDDSP